MTILEFTEQFPTESSCRDDFKLQREKEGIFCKKCNHTAHYWLKGKSQWECKSCKFRTGLKSGSMMENSNLPVRTWYLAMLFMTFTKKGISAKELQRQLNHNRYDTIWSLMHRIRNAMGNRDNLYTLNGMVEFDEGYYEIATAEHIKLKRGKGSQKQQNVAVMAESVPLEDIETGKKIKSCRYFKMKALDTHKTDSIDQVIQENVDQKSVVFSDRANTYFNISDYVDTHMSEKSTKETTANTLKWVHIAISNAKRNLLGVYHKIKDLRLRGENTVFGYFVQQLYLDEFC